ncbi:MAG TPA: CPBP family intramembrane glutamic endopeptidase [Candidatus Dormibacteraeota bacterium]|nr:CPBP family intramembrane glutamic endopeptidase [Candidatus Dormibacteraeota bacterium]
MLLSFLFAAIVVLFLPTRAWQRYRKKTPPTPPTRYIAETATLIALLSFLLWRNDISFRTLGLSGHPPVRWFADAATCLLVIVGADFFMYGKTVRQLRSGATLSDLKGLAADALSAQSLGLEFLFVTIIGAVWEELCFRGTVFALVPHTSVWMLSALIASSLLFGAQHLRNGMHGMVYSTLFGLVFASLFLITGNLWAVMLAHAVGNLLAAWQWAPRIERARKQSISRALGFLG